MRKNCSSDQEKLWKFEDEGRDLANFLRSLGQFIQAVKCQENFEIGKIVFCYQNCPDLLREKIVLVIEKKLLKFEAKNQEFAKILRLLEQFIQTLHTAF